MALKKDDIRGISTSQELTQNVDSAITESIFKTIFDISKSKNFSKIFGVILIALILYFPSIAEFFFLIGICCFFVFKEKIKKFKFIIRPPKSSGLPDYNQFDNKGKPLAPIGVLFLGNERATNQEIWLGDTDVRRHFLIFGTTGSGKAYLLNERFITKRGLVENQNLTYDDYILTPFGYFSKVVGLFPQKSQKMATLTFANGVKKKVSVDHLWTVFRGLKTFKEEVDFETFFKSQHLLTLETKLLKSYLNNGEKLYIPYSNLLVSEEVKKSNEEIVELATYFNSILFNARFEKNEKIEELKKFFLLGSFAQKTLFKQTLLDLIKSSVNTRFIISKGKEVSKIFFKNSDLAKLTAMLFGGLGYVTQFKENHFEQTLIILNQQLYLEIENIEYEEETLDCQCVKIEDERGLIVLEDFIVSHNTEAILSIIANILVQGSGFAFIDGKSDLKTLAKVFSICRRFRREDDLLVINYGTSGKDVFGKQEKIMSNTMNPFGSGSSGSLTELIVSLLDSGGNSDPMWQGRAISLASAVIIALVWIRDNEGKELDIEAIRSHLTLEEVIKLGTRPYGKEEKDNDDRIKLAVSSYLKSIPGYEAGKSANEQHKTVPEQHGYLQMQFTKILSSLTDTYGYIFKTNLGHIDFRDIALNRRIFVSLIPSLEKSGAELQNLGKIIVSSLKAMMSTTLGSDMDGNARDSFYNSVTESFSSFYVILDEYGYYIVKDSAVMPAQARSLGFCMIFAGQDLPSFQKNNNKEEALSIVANCNLKVCMKIEDPHETFQLFNSSAGKARVEVYQGKERDKSSLFSIYRVTDSVKYELRDRVEWLDLKKQSQGEAHLLFEDKLIRFRFFYADPPVPEDQIYRINYFVKVSAPKKEEIEKYLINMERNIEEYADDEAMRNHISGLASAPIWKDFKTFVEDAKVSGATKNIGKLFVAKMLKESISVDDAMRVESASSYEGYQSSYMEKAKKQLENSRSLTNNVAIQVLMKKGNEKLQDGSQIKEEAAKKAKQVSVIANYPNMDMEDLPEESFLEKISTAIDVLKKGQEED